MKLNRLILLVILVIAVAVVGAACSAKVDEPSVTESSQDGQLQMVEDALQQALLAIDSAEPVKVAFSEDVKQALEAQGISFVFSNTTVKNAIAEKFALLYQKKDVDGLLDYLAFLDANHAAGLMAEGQTFDICFSDAYINDLKQFIMENGVYLESNGNSEIYSYGGSEFWLSSFVYIKHDYELDGAGKSMTVILGGTDYRTEQHETYSEDSVGYFLVDQTAELVISQYTAAEKEHGNCHRCDGTGKVTVHFGVSWNQKEGYRYGERCGLCGGTGWTD